MHGEQRPGSGRQRDQHGARPITGATGASTPAAVIAEIVTDPIATCSTAAISHTISSGAAVLAEKKRPRISPSPASPIVVASEPPTPVRMRICPLAEPVGHGGLHHLAPVGNPDDGGGPDQRQQQRDHRLTQEREHRVGHPGGVEDGARGDEQQAHQQRPEQQGQRELATRGAGHHGAGGDRACACATPGPALRVRAWAVRGTGTGGSSPALPASGAAVSGEWASAPAGAPATTGSCSSRAGSHQPRRSSTDMIPVAISTVGTTTTRPRISICPRAPRAHRRARPRRPRGP